MRSISEQLDARKWLEEYVNSPIKIPTREEAIENLVRLGILDKNGNIKPEWQGLIAKKDWFYLYIYGVNYGKN